MLTKDQKIKLAQDLTDNIGKAKSIVVADYRGLKVNQVQQLRKNLREQNIQAIVIKNTLLKLALKNNSLSLDENCFKKPLIIAIDANDEVAPCKIFNDFTKENEKLEIVGGIIDGKQVDAAGVKSYATLPSREELYAKVVGSIAAPISGLVNVLSGNLRGLVSVLKQYSEKSN